MTYTGEMVLPKNAVVMEETEMRYLEGGVSIKVKPYMATKNGALAAAKKYASKAKMGKFRAMIEIYAHARLYYYSHLASAISKKIGSTSIVKYILNHSNPIDLGNDSAARVAAYAYIYRWF